uniref:Fibronectin type-II domain-containing protein n=1 Tax=Bos mutus grunniens TaxID=30521 RepID=A0A8B9XCM6_BOSMU
LALKLPWHRVGLFLIWAGASVFQQLHPVNGEFLMFVELTDFLLPGPACAFPFTYKGKKYYMCTRKNSVLLWCSLDTEYQGNWKFCTERDEPECVFPFIYHKKSYESCTRVHSFFRRSWCSLTSNYDRDKAWKYC